jgi:hypothetical protein
MKYLELEMQCNKFFYMEYGYFTLYKAHTDEARPD